MRGFNYKKVVQSLNFFSIKNSGKIHKIKAIKLIWLCDRLHLRKYGRTISGDVYYALLFGPVPSATKNILETNSFIDDIASIYAKNFIVNIGRYTLKSVSEPDFKVFSDTEKEILEIIFNSFSHLKEFELYDLSHKFPEWKKHEAALNAKLSSRFEIDQYDFFINFEERSGLFVDETESLTVSKKIYAEANSFVSLLQ